MAMSIVLAVSSNGRPVACNLLAATAGEMLDRDDIGHLCITDNTPAITLFAEMTPRSEILGLLAWHMAFADCCCLQNDDSIAPRMSAAKEVRADDSRPNALRLPGWLVTSFGTRECYCEYRWTRSLGSLPIRVQPNDSMASDTQTVKPYLASRNFVRLALVNALSSCNKKLEAFQNAIQRASRLARLQAQSWKNVTSTTDLSGSICLSVCSSDRRSRLLMARLLM